MRMKSIALALFLLAGAGPAVANCYEDIGCTDSNQFSKSQLRRLSCENLWMVRNEIYKEAGYCFKTQRAIDYFGNEQCTIEDMSAVPLSSIERYNINQIVSVEREMACN